MAYFNATETEELPDYDVLPSGDYRVIVKEATEKTTRAGSGTFVAVQFEVISGAHANRIVFDNFNLTNPSEKATEIGRSNFAKCLKAAGRPVIEAPEQLEGASLTITVAVTKDRQTGEPRNVIKKYMATTNPTTTNGATTTAYSNDAGVDAPNF